MSTNKVLIVGSPGSGKTYVSEKLRNNGINAWDADMVSGLCKWVDIEGNTVAFPKEASKEWLSIHNFLWDKAFLEKWLNEQEPVYLFGISSNVFEMFDLFDKVFFLEIDESELRKRLDNPGRKNPMGKTEEQKQNIINGMIRNKDRAVTGGAKLVDATLKPEEIYKILSS